MQRTYYIFADNQGKRPAQLLINHPDAAAPIEIVYIFEHTTVQEFLDILDRARTYECLFEEEIINKIPQYYFMITLGLKSGTVIGRKER